MQGTFGTVYQEGQYAIKRSSHYSAIFMEIFISRRVKSPYIIEIPHARLLMSEIETMMPWYPSDLYKIHSRLDISTCELCFQHIAIALDYIHAIGVIHCDIKPSNILFDPDEGKFVLTDFGISQIYRGVPMTQTIVTYLYRPPEINIDGDKKIYDTSVDVWSFGATMYWLFTKINVIADLHHEPACVRNELIKVYKTTNDKFDSLNLQHVTNILNEHWNHTPFYLNIVARCLLPDPKARIRASNIVSMLNIEPFCATVTIAETLSRHVDLEVTINLPDSIISSCTSEIMNYAQSLYQKYNDQYGVMEHDHINKYICIYISSQLWMECPGDLCKSIKKIFVRDKLNFRNELIRFLTAIQLAI